MAEMTANGLRFHVQTLKRGSAGRAWPQVVMVHGLSVDLSCFYVTIAGGVAVESDVHLYDLRGHGRSEIPPRPYRVADHVADLVALLDGWRLDEPVHVIGNSYGGIIALTLAHHHPERVASLFLIEPHLSDDRWGPRMADSIRDFADDPAETQRWMGADAARQRWARRNESMLRTTSILDDLAAEPDVPAEWLENLSCPVFSLYGSDSDVVERAVARDRRIPGCEPLILDGGTHMVLAEAGGVIRDHAVAWIRQQNRPAAA
ncbi:MAG TPA: alpha/beta fold hydrolase [Acidimicrobiales bacterium]|jgi:pimeloyl-ACP methyl ester carboxylesterase|nr:alpha/beta fold hydrolase [Acidimicrobiales bacterium]